MSGFGRGLRPTVALMARVAIVGIASLVGIASPGAAQIRYSGGISFSRGEYIFDQPTNSFYLSNRISARKSRFDLSLSLPVIFQEDGAITWVAGTPLPTGGTRSGIVAGRGSGATVGTGRGRGGHQPPTPADSLVIIDSGYSASVADPTLGLSADLYSGFGFLRSFSVDGRVKAPVTELGEASGTGEWDYSVGTSLTVGLQGVLAFIDANYWWIGDLPELELLNSLNYGAGLLVPASGQRPSFLLGVSGSSKTIPTADVPLSVDAAAGLGVGDRGFLSVGFGVGLTETAPDFTVQAGWSVGLFGLRR